MQKLLDALQHTRPGQLALLGLPFDDNSSFLKGPAQAPPLIRKALHSDASNLWNEAGMDLGAPGMILDAGDVEFSTPALAFHHVEKVVALLLERGLKPICLGGDHSLTYPVVRAFYKAFGRVHILHFDAHPDLYDELQGNRYSHACPFARIMEERLAGRLVQVGIRTINGHQRAQAEKYGVEAHEMKTGLGGIVLRFDAPVYVSFDVDALDPAFAPGVSHHEPGGLSTREAIALIQSIAAPAVVGADIVEFNPARDPLGITAAACAKILKELAGKML